MIDPTSFRAYCEFVFRDSPPGGLIALHGFAEKNKVDGSNVQWLDPRAPRWNDGVVAFVRTCNNRGLAAYCIPCFVSGRRAAAVDVLTLPTLVIDFDSGDIVENCMKATRILGTSSLAVRSGGTTNNQPKTHLSWRIMAMPRLSA